MYGICIEKCAAIAFKDNYSYPVPKYSCRRRDVLICKFLLLLKFLTNGWEKPSYSNVFIINYFPRLVQREDEKGYPHYSL
jgi:hypothetical protein